MSNFATYEQLIEISNKISKKVPQGIMLGNAPVGHIEWQMYLQRDYLKLDGTPLANASNDYDELLKFAQDNSLITSDTTDKSLFKYDSTNDVLTLPDYIGLCLQGGNTVEEKEAGLPNIKGNIPNGIMSTYVYTGTQTDIGVGSIGAKAYNYYENYSTGDKSLLLLSIDASKSNPIYSDTVNTVQPPAITLIPQIKYIKGTTVWEELDFNKLMPLGTVINFMGTTAPDYYLACDGTVYNILEYSALANFFEVQFGSKNFFGGDGTTTFAVPDLRGEFLRGTGTNSHVSALGEGIKEGSGASVGTHQGATTIYRMDGGEDYVYVHNTAYYKGPANYDAGLFSNRTGRIAVSHNEQTGVAMYVTARPTNTSVLYCIKYK